MIKLTPGKLWGMRRLADRNGFFMMTAVDQRPPIKTPIARHYGLDEAPYDDVARFNHRQATDRLLGALMDGTDAEHFRA